MHNKKNFRYLKNLVIFLALILPVIIPGIATAAGNAIVSIAVPADALDMGEQFTIGIIIEPNNAIAGTQFNMSYDPDVVTVDSISEGNLLSQSGASTYFNDGEVDNVAGTITGVFGAIISPGQTVATAGTFVVITMTAGIAIGSSPLTLSNVVIGNAQAQPVAASIINNTVNVGASSSPPPSGGGGIGGGGSSAASSTFSLRGLTTTDGQMLEDVIATDIDSKVSLYLPEGTFVRNKYGQALVSLSITPKEEVQAASSGSVMIGQPYAIEPEGATFEGSASLIFQYSEIPAGIPANNLYIALWDEDTIAWTDLGGTVDAGAGTITIPINHLSTYTLMAHNRPASIVVRSLFLTPNEVAPGEAVTASVEIYNQGDLTGTYQASLILDNAAMQNKTVTVNGGSHETIVFTIILDTVGEHQVSLGGFTSTVVVKNPAASFTASDLQIDPISVISGGKVNINVFIKNTGDLRGIYPISLSVDDVVVETREVTLDGGGSMTVSFSFTAGTAGEHTVSISDLEGVFEVSQSSPPAALEVSGWELDGFSTTPSYDEVTNTLVSVRIEYQMNQSWTSESDARLLMAVFYDGKPLEQIPLFTLSHLTEDGKTGVFSYIPTAGWMAGEYTFQAELYEGENFIQGTLLHSLVVTPEAITKVISWWTLGAVIGIATIFIFVLLTVIVYRRREMLR